MPGSIKPTHEFEVLRAFARSVVPAMRDVGLSNGDVACILAIAFGELIATVEIDTTPAEMLASFCRTAQSAYDVVKS